MTGGPFKDVDRVEIVRKHFLYLISIEQCSKRKEKGGINLEAGLNW